MTPCSIGWSEIMSTYAKHRRPPCLCIPPPLPTWHTDRKQQEVADAYVKHQSNACPLVDADSLYMAVANAPKSSVLSFAPVQAWKHPLSHSSWSSFELLRACVQCGVCAFKVSFWSALLSESTVPPCGDNVKHKPAKRKIGLKKLSAKRFLTPYKHSGGSANMWDKLLLY